MQLGMTMGRYIGQSSLEATRACATAHSSGPDFVEIGRAPAYGPKPVLEGGGVKSGVDPIADKAGEPPARVACQSFGQTSFS
jgi:hypothetical protein